MSAVGSDGQCVGVAALAVGMDKVAMRRAFAAEGIPVVAGAWFTRRQWQLRAAGRVGEDLTAAEGLPWPRFVKTASMGSSIGVSRVRISRVGPDR